MAATSRYQNMFSINICRNQDFPVLIINVLFTVLLVTVRVLNHAMLRTN